VRREFWTLERRDIAWKIFARRSEEFEQWMIGPFREIFRQELEAVLAKLPKADKESWRKVNIDKEIEQKKLVETATPYIQEIMVRYGQERLEDMLSMKAAVFRFNVNDPAVKQWIGDRMARFSRQVTGTTFDEIAEIIKAGFGEGLPLSTIAQNLRDKFAIWNKYRAPLMSRTETISAMNRADIFAVEQAGLKEQLKKHWLSARDSYVRETHRQAEKRYAAGIEVDKMFIVGRDSMLAPGLGSDPRENINCRCALYYSKVAIGEEIPYDPSIAATTIQEARERLAALRVEKLTLGSQPEEEAIKQANFVCEELLRIKKRIPQIEKILGEGSWIRELGIENVEYLRIKEGNEVSGICWEIKKVIYLAGRLKKIHELTPGKYAVSYDFMTIFRHELGHIVYKAMSPGDQKIWGHFWSVMDKEKIKSMISIYAAVRNEREFFSEAFAMFTSPLYRTKMLPEAVENFFKRVFGPKRGRKLMSADIREKMEETASAVLREPECSKRRCKHFRGIRDLGEKPEEDSLPYGKFVCEAFPEGIPPELAYWRIAHTKPYPGDHGIQYEELPEGEEVHWF